ncbi:MAG: hypothetical protein KatS3mg076_0875 [Candidatus Binatia bacterium]|nr:MAG: hypothetical protein KatS3mg076_0875 [Candidatus Binatia bacterium]
MGAGTRSCRAGTSSPPLGRSEGHALSWPCSRWRGRRSFRRERTRTMRRPPDATERVPPAWVLPMERRASLQTAGRFIPPGPSDVSEGHALSWPCSPEGPALSRPCRAPERRSAAPGRDGARPSGCPCSRMAGTSILPMRRDDVRCPTPGRDGARPSGRVRVRPSERRASLQTRRARSYPAPLGRIGGPRSVVAVFIGGTRSVGSVFALALNVDPPPARTRRSASLRAATVADSNVVHRVRGGTSPADACGVSRPARQAALSTILRRARNRPGGVE